MVERRWENAELNFDHLGKAMVSLFVVATLNGYSEPMDAGASVARGVADMSGSAAAHVGCWWLQPIRATRLPSGVPAGQLPTGLRALPAYGHASQPWRRHMTRACSPRR